MKPSNDIETPRDPADARLLESAQRQLDALRATIDARLSELDAALADPSRASSLTGLILELSRLATAEAQAAATRACLQIKSDGEAAILEAEARSLAAVEAERRTASDLRKNLDKAQKKLDLVESEKHAVLQAAREQTQLLESERGSRAELDRTITHLEHQVAQAQASLGEADEAVERSGTERTLALERAAALEHDLATLREQASELERQLAAAHASAAGLGEERRAADDRSAELRLELDAARGDAARHLEEQRQAAAAAARELAAERQARTDLSAHLDSLTRQLESERMVTADLRSAISAATSAVSGEQQAVSALRQAAADAEQRAAELRAAQAESRSALEATERDLEHERQRLATLERAHAELGHAHGALEQTHTELARAHSELEHTTASLQAHLEAERAQKGDADSGLRTELERARADAARAHADLAETQQRVAALEQARASAEEATLAHEERATLIERERDALSLALDTERMTTADLRQAADSAERRFADASGDLDELRQQVAQLRAAAHASRGADDDEADVTELTFDEDRVDEPGDGAITLEEEGWESVRLSTRYNFPVHIDITVNGVAGVLCDLSVGGCGVRTTAPLETGDTARVQLPQDPTPLLCVGQVVWVRKDAAGKAPAHLRAGIQFTKVDEGALETFIIMHADV